MPLSDTPLTDRHTNDDEQRGSPSRVRRRTTLRAKPRTNIKSVPRYYRVDGIGADKASIAVKNTWEDYVGMI